MTVDEVLTEWGAVGGKKRERGDGKKSMLCNKGIIIHTCKRLSNYSTHAWNELVLV